METCRWADGDHSAAGVGLRILRTGVAGFSKGAEASDAPWFALPRGLLARSWYSGAGLWPVRGALPRRLG